MRAPSREPRNLAADRAGASRAAPVLLAAGLTLVSGAAVARAQGSITANLPRVAEVTVEGAHTLDEDDMKKVLKTHARSWFAFWSQGPWFRQDFLQSDVQILRQFAVQHGFLDARTSGFTEKAKGANRVRVIFRIEEGLRSSVRQVTVSGANQFTTSDLLDKAITRPGAYFNPQGLAADQQKMADQYAERGFFPVITPSWERPESTLVDAHFEIAEGPSYHVGTVSIEGLKDVDTVVVRRELLLRPGNSFQRSALQRSSERLYQTRLFSLVDFEPAHVDTVKAEVSLLVRLRERKHRAIEGGTGVGSADGLRLLGSWEHGNLWHRGRRLDATSAYTFGRRRRFNNRLSFTEPWLFGTRTEGTLATYFNQNEVEFRGATFDQRNWGVAFSAQRDLSRFARASLTLDNQWSRAVTVPELPDSELTDFERGQFFTNRLSLGWSYDRRDDVFDPRRGELYLWSGDLAGKLLGGQGQFLKGTASGARYLPRGTRSSLALRLQVGGIRPYGESGASPLIVVPFNDLYRIGGATTVRGYAEEAIVGADGTGGLLLVLTNVELRFPVTAALGGAVFLDGGNVWSRPRDFKWKDFGLGGGPAEGNDYRWSTGAGVRIKTPVGPFRFDLGYRLRDYLQPGGKVKKAGWAYHLSLGQAY